MASNSEILIVDDDEAEAKQVANYLGHFGACRAVHSIDAAMAAIDDGIVCALVVEARLGEQLTGLQIVERFRAEKPFAPALIRTRCCERAVVAAAYRLNVPVLLKSTDGLDRFAIACLVAVREPISPFGEALAEMAAMYGLTERQTQVLHGGAHGRTLEWFMSEGGLSESAYRSRIEALLDKAVADDLDTLVRELLWLTIHKACSRSP